MMIERVFLTAAALACSLLAVPAPAAPAAQGEGTAAAALLAKHRAYAGWSAGDGSIRSLHAVGAVTRGGRRIGELEAFHAGPLERFVERGPTGVRQNGFDGRRFWSSNENGFVVPTLGEPVKRLIAEDAVFGEGLDDAPATVVGDATVGTRTLAVVRVQPQVGFAVDLAIDPSSGALERAVIDPGGLYEERINVTGYSEVAPGKRVISAWNYGGKALLAYTTLEANGNLAPEALQAPKPSASWTFGGDGATAVRIVGDAIRFQAAVNGHRGTFVLDTGASGMALTDSFARSAGAVRVGRTGIAGIGGGAAANVYRVDSFAVGPHVLHDVRILTGLDEALARDTDGYIGFDLLAGAIVDLNLDDLTMRLADPAKVEPNPEQGFTVSADLTDGVPRVPMTLSGRARVIATLDSGNSAPVLFSREVLADKRISFIGRQQGQIYGVNGSEVDLCGKLQSLLLGPITFADVTGCASESMGAHDVLVGFDFMKHFNYVFDYADGKLLLTPRKRG
jgi:predicted aspartyl protease